MLEGLPEDAGDTKKTDSLLIVSKWPIQYAAGS